MLLFRVHVLFRPIPSLMLGRVVHSRDVAQAIWLMLCSGQLNPPSLLSGEVGTIKVWVW